MTDGAPILVSVGPESGNIDFALARQPCGSPSLFVSFPPTIDPQSFVAGCSVQINGGVDPEWPFCPGVTRVEWSWGDGTVMDSWFPASHTYAPGLAGATVSATAHDASGATSLVTGTVDLDLLLTGQTVASSETFTACNAIEATDFEVVQPAGDATLEAGTAVVFGDGLVVEDNCTLSASAPSPSPP